MGIPTLNKWLETHSHLEQTASFEPGSKPKRPEIVVDGWNFASSIMRHRPKEALFQDGMCIQQQIKQYVAQFQSCGFKLIVFLDGWFNMNKMDEKIVRNRQRIRRQCMLSAQVDEFHKLEMDEQKKFSWSRSLIADCLTWKFTYAQALTKFGCTVYFTKEEADRTIAQYAREHSDRVIGIFSRDTDFLAFDLPSHTMIIREARRKTTNKNNKSNKGGRKKSGLLTLKYLSIDKVWQSLGASTFEERLKVIAWIGCDFVPRRSCATIGKQSVGRVLKMTDLSVERLRIVEEFYSLSDRSSDLVVPVSVSDGDSDDANGVVVESGLVNCKWMENVASQSDSRSWFTQIRDSRVVSVSCRLGAMDVRAAALIVRDLRRHLYAVIDVDAVTEVVMVGDVDSGQEVTDDIGSLVRVEKCFNTTIDECIQEFIGTQPTLSSIILASCHIFADISPFSETETQKMAEIFDKQFQVVMKNVENRVLGCVRGIIRGGAPRMRDMTAVNLILEVVKIVHCLVGEYDVPAIWTWFNIPLFHLGMQQPRKFNEVLHSCGIEPLTFVRGRGRRDSPNQKMAKAGRGKGRGSRRRN